MFQIVQAGILRGTGYQLLPGFPAHSLGQETLWCARPTLKPPCAKTDAQLLQSPGRCGTPSPLRVATDTVGWLQKRSLKDLRSISNGLVIGTL